MLFHLNSDLVPQELADRYVSTLALAITCAFLSDRLFLYVPTMDHMVDQITGETHGTEDARIIKVAQEFADGAFIGASIGSRTSVSFQSKPSVHL
jgi:hypothetical protein